MNISWPDEEPRMQIDLSQLIADMKAAASQALGNDVSVLRGFSERQLQAIAQQADFVASGILSGQISAETRDFFLDSLEDMTLNFVRTLRGLLMVTIEKVWNAMVGVIWQAISKVTQLVLPLPSLG
ncbi:hypothetical protein [Chitinimonas taiwanensis]|nr:hypothetical protein [Chitinimonas taiwanensis]